MEALPTVEAFVHERLTKLGVDADSYANYVAGVLADDSQSNDERKAVLTEMLVLTVEDRDITEGVSAFLDEVFVFQDAEVVRIREERTLASARAAEEAAARAGRAESSAKELEERRQEEAVKRAIMLQYGYVEEDEEEGAGDAAASGAAGKGGKPKKEKAGSAEAAAQAARGSRLDAALDEIDDVTAERARDTGMGRRAKRAAAASGDVERAAARQREREELTKTALASAGNLAARAALGAATAGIGGAGSAKFSRDAARERDDLTADMLGRGSGSAAASASAGRGKGAGATAGAAAGSAATGGGGDDSDGEEYGARYDDDDDGPAISSVSAPSGSGRPAVVHYDPLAELGRIDNRAAARDRAKARLEEESSKHSNEQRRLKEAAEAARCVLWRWEGRPERVGCCLRVAALQRTICSCSRLDIATLGFAPSPRNHSFCLSIQTVCQPDASMLARAAPSVTCRAAREVARQNRYTNAAGLTGGRS
jgi:hypothetical protein